MKKLFSYMTLAAGLLAGFTGQAVADELKLTITDGRVTLIANEVPVRQILAEWARIGGTKIVNGEKMIGPPLTIELRDVPEGRALETVLRSAAGYVVAPRISGVGASSFDSIVILATSRPPAVSPVTPAPFSPRPNTQPMLPTVDEDDEEPEEASPVTGQMPFSPQFPGRGVPPPGSRTQVPNGVQQAPQGPMTAPRPGQLPVVPGGPVNPYAPQLPPGSPSAPSVPGAVPRPGGGGGN
jgi:hypothetical protein